MPLLPLPTSSPLLPLETPPPHFFPCSSNRPRGAATSRLPWMPLAGSFSFTSRPPPALAAATSDQDLLQALVGSDDGEDDGRTHLPAVRTYENDLARLTLVGAVGFDQALAAAAADGGDAAEEHLASGLPTMVIETLYPGGASRHSTVSTRLFLPSREVKEKGRRIRRSLEDGILSSTNKKNILAMTFRQVVLQRILSFELALFPPGTERDMGNLDSSREVIELILSSLCFSRLLITALFSISSSNEMVIAMLAEAICSCALESTKRGYLKLEGGKAPSVISGWFQKPQVTASSDSSVCLYSIPPNQVFENARKRLDSFISMKGRSSKQNRGVKRHWWLSPTYSNLEKIGGLGFSDWANEHIPAYRLQIDSKKLKDAKFQGWQKLADNRWEALLTHSQMVELADIIDMYYEDRYTLPDKHLACGLIERVSNGARSERRIFWKVLSTILLGGCVLFSLRIMAQIHWRHLLKPRNSSIIPMSNSESEIDYFWPQILEADKLEDLCLSVVKRIQDAVGRHEDVTVDKDVGAWTGQLPSCLTKLPGAEAVQNVSENEDSSNPSYRVLPIQTGSSSSEISPSGANRSDIVSASQDIASYQVVLSRDGKVIGLQPTSRPAVNHWAANPLAQELYEGKKLSPGLLEARLKIHQPGEVVLIELLMSVNPDSWFVLARPFQ
ncbi:hypothetical protein Taro_023094 [Colocasia esculenta]|uniref:Uncharacterized protein n=1 Tax=Colocasia esculenta TaxID=4460 RepID=A0A843V3P5_COLES|nr:hypothetical protein [Colocasia esculenta]